MALKVYKVANSLGLKLYFHWRSREDPTMQLVDRGSRGPWLDFDDFASSITEVLSRGINLDSFASFHNRVVNRYFSYGFQIEAEGTDFFTQKFSSTNVILIHCHPLIPYDALTHASHFRCEVVVVMHLWQRYPPYRNFLREGHLPNFFRTLS